MQSDLFSASTKQTLSPSFPEKMVILDCETTGGKSEYHRVIEIGLLLVDDGIVTKRWQSFLDPERDLPPFITRLTGISPGMLVDQPKFADIAGELAEQLKDRVFVAHNARFDYSFIKKEFARLDTPFTAKTFCSVKFSRALYPQFKRHGLDHIIKRFEFPIENRHRALDDAEMVWRLFVKSSQLYSNEEITSVVAPLLKSPSLPSHIKQADIKALPQAAGVYYFYDEKNVLLYVGKSVNIRSRVMSHFTQDHRSSKELIMTSKVAHIDFTRTPTDLGAQLLESAEIKKLSPLYNRRLRRTRKLFSYEIETNPAGYKTASIRQIDSDQTPDESVGLFRSPRQAGARLEKLADDYFLCNKLLGLEGHPEDHSPCFRRQLKRCFGACEGTEPASDYNARFEIAFNKHQLITWPYSGAVLVEEVDPNDPEFKQFHVVDDWRYISLIKQESDLHELGYAANMQANAVSMSSNDKNTPPEQCAHFDLDTYHILLRFLMKAEQQKMNLLKIHPLIAINKLE